MDMWGAYYNVGNGKSVLFFLSDDIKSDRWRFSTPWQCLAISFFFVVSFFPLGIIGRIECVQNAQDAERPRWWWGNGKRGIYNKGEKNRVGRWAFFFSDILAGLGWERELGGRLFIFFFSLYVSCCCCLI
ncbi:hypothetical protein K440DRAFT_56083 [Wilcoxina mikolae CBS 423.85]|nr:hypothetical protein K440DRAFT_56083 [Wilcoxina mikolae CBS 423.85]